MYWLDGEARQQIDLCDRGLQYGDGCFTTARIVNGRVDGLRAHLARMQHACERLMIHGVDWPRWQAEAEQSAATRDEGVLKAIVTRGCGGRGYDPAESHSPRRIFSTGPLPAHYPALRERGISLVVSPVRLAHQPLLAGIKHLNRLEQVLIRASLAQTQADEALVLDTQDNLVECCAANLFWRSGQRVFTPRLTRCGVDGLMRQRICRVLAHSEYHLAEVDAALPALLAADEVVVCNALMPLLPVRRAATQVFSERTLYQFLLPHCLRVEA
ncbi:aminodeoxychorismate lyase [Edwardsiella piscicida]|uniref:aminodeoxychorismate lyase n=1 Tax=Edwardsiella piscicida TaxID=1263550 RepID=UPI0029093164|nr:aminodeoxychorismate lyase [Edwardsiella piscicida]ELM3730218.1 aminodeoxychorismate lyase [Edwardsiella piscicida]ELV7536186.1 aminodeoxychorismate lyase [Edwardsiella piscicida]